MKKTLILILLGLIISLMGCRGSYNGTEAEIESSQTVEEETDDMTETTEEDETEKVTEIEDSVTEDKTEVNTETTEEDKTEVNTETTEEDETEVDTEIEENVSLIPDGASPLEANELEWFATQFFNTDEQRIRNMFLLERFDSPERVNFVHTFGMGTLNEESRDVTDEEISLLETRYNAMTNLDTIKITSTELNLLLLENIGMGLEDTEKIDLEYLHYLIEYDSFYTCSGDMSYREYEFYDGWTNKDGSVTLRYMHRYKVVYRVTLEPREGKYYFVSNLPED